MFLGLIFFKLRRVCGFFSLTARGYVQPLTTEHCGSVHYITIGDSRLLTAAGFTRSPLYLIGDAASRCGLSRVGYFIPLNGRCPLNGHPPSSHIYLGPYIKLCVCCCRVEINDIENASDGVETLKLVLEIFDYLTLCVFVLEIILKWLDNFWHFWKNRWNIFDFVVTLMVRLTSLWSSETCVFISLLILSIHLMRGLPLVSFQLRRPTIYHNV